MTTIFDNPIKKIILSPQMPRGQTQFSAQFKTQCDEPKTGLFLLLPAHDGLHRHMFKRFRHCAKTFRQSEPKGSTKAHIS